MHNSTTELEGPTAPVAAEPPTALRRRTVGSVAGLRAMRTDLASWLAELGVETERFVADVQLATVEIVTNAFVHGAAGSVDVGIDVVDGELMVTTSHDSTSTTGIDLPGQLPPTESISGRGLYLVDQIVRTRTVSNGDGWSRTMLAIPLPA